MQATEIKSVFALAGVAVPPPVLERLTPEEEYDDFQSWCCGMDATQVEGGGILVKTYCLRFRAPQVHRWIAYPDGSWEELEPLPAEHWSDVPDE
jgi:hypothetical protein